MPIALAVLSPCRLFEGLSPELVKPWADRMRLVSLRRREAVTTVSGEPFDGLGVVLSGAVQSIDSTGDGREVALATAVALEPFGLAELLASRARVGHWMASAPSTAVGLLARRDALELFAEPALALRAASRLAQQVCDVQSLQKVLTVHPVSARVCAWLRWQGEGTQGVVQVPTHAELAWQLNTTRESVTRVFQKLFSDGVIARAESGWRIADWAALTEGSQPRSRE
jgi:CRP/FNR family cyclic AMP-dependent transcriptional regulator